MSKIIPYEEFKTKVKRECSQILDFYKSLDFSHLLYRGYGYKNRLFNENRDVSFVMQYPVDRQPKDSSLLAQNYLNNVFDFYKCTANRSNSIFCTTDIYATHVYSLGGFHQIGIVFPKDGFKFTTSYKIDDFYFYLTSPLINANPHIFSDFLTKADLISKNTFGLDYFFKIFKVFRDEENVSFISQITNKRKQLIATVLRAFFDPYARIPNKETMNIVENISMKDVYFSYELFKSYLKKYGSFEFDKDKLGYDQFGKVINFLYKILAKTNFHLNIENYLNLTSQKNYIRLPFSVYDRGDWFLFVHPTDVIKFNLFDLHNEKNSNFRDALVKAGKNEIMITDDNDYYVIFPHEILNDDSIEDRSGFDIKVKEFLKKEFE